LILNHNFKSNEFKSFPTLYSSAQNPITLVVRSQAFDLRFTDINPMQSRVNQGH